MAVEAKRGCGFRKVGGLYLVAEGMAVSCDRLPFPLTVCPTCSAGIKQTRGWTWVSLAALLGGRHEPCADMRGCVVCEGKVEKAGLLWIGERFYRTPADFNREAFALGVSRRIGAIPKGFKVGETWVLLAHAKAIPARPVIDDEESFEPSAGIFQAFRPERIEILITESQSADEAYVTSLQKRGLTPVVVPDNDRDHQGSIYDPEDEPALPFEQPAEDVNV